jgi:hypothetical protein
MEFYDVATCRGEIYLAKKKKQIIIPKEKAVFWMNENGDWYNKHGKFEHPKIIKHFHASIQKDHKGYYVHQETDDYEEKVYFPYKETALFVFDIKEENDIISLELNNSDIIKLDPKHLFEKDDKLFLKTNGHLIQFADKALLKISRFLKEEKGQLLFQIKGTSYRI